MLGINCIMFMIKYFRWYNEIYDTYISTRHNLCIKILPSLLGIPRFLFIPLLVFIWFIIYWNDIFKNPENKHRSLRCKCTFDIQQLFGPHIKMSNCKHILYKWAVQSVYINCAFNIIHMFSKVLPMILTDEITYMKPDTIMTINDTILINIIDYLLLNIFCCLPFAVTCTYIMYRR